MAYVIKTNGSTKINPKTLNIDGSDDPFYRYKMRQLYVQVVGKGKMIKTVLLNVDDVSKDLKVHPKYLTAYLGYELGAQSKYDGTKPDREKASVSGERDVDTLITILKKFIADLVLCEKCRLPETYMKVDKTGEISFTCRSCGNISSNVAMKPKFKQFVLNHPAATEKQPKSAGKGKKAPGKGKENGQDGEGSKRANKKGSDDESEEDDGEEWSVDISEEAARQRLAGLLPEKLGKVLNTDTAAKEQKETKEKDEYSSVFRAFVKETKRTEEELVDELLKLQKQHGFSNAVRVRLFCQANFQPGVAPSASKLKPHLKKLVTDVDSQKSLMSCLELLMSEDLLDKVLPVLKGFYDEDILEEDVILAWHAEKPEDEAGASMRTKVQPFITWLKEAEEESEEEEDDA